MNKLAEPDSGKRLLLKDRAYQMIKRDILTGKLPAGMFLSERLLANHLNIGKAPIRDAIGRLRQENYLDVAPQQGIVVKGLTVKTMTDTFELRSILEPQIASKLAGQLPSSSKYALESNLAMQRECAEVKDIQGFIDLDVNFHLILAKAYGNQELLQIIDQICEKTYRSIYSAPRGMAEKLTFALADHEAIYQHLIQGEAKAAEERMASHINGTRSLLLP
ncbi:GntR family transcriptional regulator [Lacunimicrobium album]|jgi:DNA-binding GntR family transcriptional regulator